MIRTITSRINGGVPPGRLVASSLSTMPTISSPYTRRDGANKGVPREDMPFHHFYAEKPKLKFKSPRKRANILFQEINQEAVQRDRDAKPELFDVPFRPGDAIEFTKVVSGGVNSDKVEKQRGVVLGIRKRGLGTMVTIRDVVFGTVIERDVPMHSPLVKDVKVLEENFVKKGKKIKRAKLYYLRDRKDEMCRVSKW
uniref:50S ribosomal protein L19, chloroplastic n=1 Tax=Pseudictyota dubia TaxID=2749911 RepID=A0A7R9WGQ2_9STRA|mmetsp:Transcript_48116/g.89192  ORF Transcript_48116/g.89192 Transcript_48116/m.89192 type:complete len:197 (+) Transcript_48116:126-716(+)